MQLTVQMAIREQRRSMLWSVRRLAREAGLSPAYVSQIENGKKPLTARAAGQIAYALGVPAHDLLAMAGFIPEGHLQTAQAMAYQAMHVPEMVATARGRTDNQRRDWLIDDYLLLLGDDPSGKGNLIGAAAHMANWKLVDPEAPESRLLAEATQWLESHAEPAKSSSAIEGWDELSPADQQFIQQMVNKLRRAATDNE